jgi:hypothetical protein
MSTSAPTISEQLAALDAAPFWPRDERSVCGDFPRTEFRTAPTRIEAIEAEIARLKYAPWGVDIAAREAVLRAELNLTNSNIQQERVA